MAGRLSKADLAARQKAIDAGKGSYIRSNGSVYVIRNRDNPKHKHKYGGQGGRDELNQSRKANRGNKEDNPRAFNLRHGSPQGTDIAEGDRAMARINEENPGMDADHIYDISRSSRGASWKVQQGRGTHGEYFDNFENADIPIGHVEGNLAPLDPELNRVVKNQETEQMDTGIKNAGKESSRVFDEIRRLNFATTIGYQPAALGGFVFGQQNNQRSMPQTPYTPPTQGGYVHRSRGPSETAPVGEPGTDRTIPMMEQNITAGAKMLQGAKLVFDVARMGSLLGGSYLLR